MDHPAIRDLLGVALQWRGSSITWLEGLACVLAVVMVLANLRVHPVAWPLAILSSLLYALLFADSRLYGEAALQGVFVVLAFWGWWQWLRGRGHDGSALQVRRLAPRLRWAALAATLAAWPLLGLLLQHLTDSDVPYLDALPTVASITGQVLLGRKFVENWAVWIAVDLFSLALFAYKGLWLTTLLYALFTVLALAGWRAWQVRVRAGQAGSAGVLPHG
jgi:nicotinamide mononucleotide transporter